MPQTVTARATIVANTTKFATAAIIVNPATGSTTTAVIPASGTGSNQIFTATFSHPSGASALAGGNLLFNFSPSGVNGCWIYYDRANQTVSLANDAATLWTTGGLGLTGNLQNSRCYINLLSSSATVSGNSATLRISMAFKSLFSGTKTIYLRAVPVSGAPGPTEPKGSWISY